MKIRIEDIERPSILDCLMELLRQGYYELSSYEGNVELGVCCLYNFVFTTGLLIGMEPDGCYQGRYCYKTIFEAREAITSWNGLGDPPGNWIKYKGVGGERRNPKSQEKHID